MDLPPSPRVWDTSDPALDSAVLREGGNAVVAFKPALSPRASAAGGRRSALSALEFQSGLDLVQQSGGEVVYIYRSIGTAWVRIPPGVASQLRHSPLVDYIEPQQRWQVDGTRATRSALKRMLALAPDPQVTPWGIALVRAPLAWPISTGTGVKVEIIDTGMEPHEDLPTLLPENCSGLFGGCSDGPILFHGTHVSGIMLARDNSVGVVGVANGVEGNLVYLWRACDDTTCSIPQIVAGIDAGIFAGVRVINMSFGGQLFSQSVANAVAAAWNTGSIVLVAAAGNLKSNQTPHSDHFPAAHTNVVGVSGVRTDGTFAATSPCLDGIGGTWKSNQGTHVDLAAPFWALSTVQNSLYEDENQGWCGTSMATPHVSGTTALLWSQNPSLEQCAGRQPVNSNRERQRRGGAR